MDKECKLCGEVKPVSEFTTNKRYKDGYYKHCKVCHYTLYGRNKHLKDTYGVTNEEYTQLLQNQDYKCLVCNKKHEETPHKRLAVDHSHVTGKVRGLLCMNCNVALGNAKDSIAVLRNLISYLEKYDG